MADKILIVDDDLETLRLVGLMLQRQGYQIVAASNGTQAVQMAQSEKPDLIVLDVMMPDMDGYEVTRQLRAAAATANIPVLMFTAKSQVDDKVAGYDAGVDDYITKPTHPDELKARVKALLARALKNRTPAPASNDRGRVIGFVAARGGIGTSTLVLNVGVALSQKMKADVVLAEFRPGNGTWGLELGYVNPEGLRRLAQSKPIEISPSAVEKELISNAAGIKLLLASCNPTDVKLVNNTPQLEAILKDLAEVAPVVLVDLGTPLFPEAARLFALCDEIVVTVDPNPLSLPRTKALIEELSESGFGKAKILTVAQVNRVRADVMLSWSQVQESLGLPVSVVVTPAPELAYQSALRYTPMLLLQPDGVVAQQYVKLADTLSQRIKVT
ncbi:MAG TPA: response regulator [Anaerolineaceae bacterium]|nr:response regulator [Anaerolineaceae bacterium]